MTHTTILVVVILGLMVTVLMAGQATKNLIINSLAVGIR
jgi:hypothetical protein